MTEYIITDEWMREYERNIEDLIDFDLEYDSSTNPVPPIPARNIIVRCRDCINYSGEDNEIYPKWCMEMNAEGIEPDGFCAWAERRQP